MRKVRVEVSALTILLLLLGVVAAAEVDSLNILLPQQRSSSRLPLQLITAEGGCYSWSSSAPAIISTSMLDQTPASCSKRAVVEVIQPGPHYSTISISAIEQSSQSSLLIPVRIRPLSRLSIVTKSRMMNIRELQKLEITGYDAEQNTFTSLEGLRFRWTLEQEGEIINKVSLTQGHLYLPLRTRELLEGQGFQSDLLIVRAIAPGNLTVHVSCSQAGYEHLTDSITLSVHERFELKPGPVLRLLPQSFFQMQLETPSGELIALPHSYYKIVSCDQFKINSTLYLQAPTQPQECTITVSDIRTIPAFYSSVKVIVDYPIKMMIFTDPHLIVGVPSPYEIKFFGQEGEVIHGQSRQLTVQSRFAVNKQLKIITASTKSSGKIKAILGDLKVQQQLESFLQIRPLLNNDYLHLPVDEHFEVKVVGGSGSYDYSLAHEIGEIKSKGVLNCRQPGETTITVSDRRDPKNKATIRLKVSNIHSIRDLEEQKEVNKDEWGNFYIVGRSSAGQTYSQCRQSKFTVSTPYKIEIEKKVNFTDSLRVLAEHDSKIVRQALSETSQLRAGLQELVDSFKLYTRFYEIQQRQLRRELINLQNYGICDIVRFRSLLPFESTAHVELQGASSLIAANLPLRVYQPILTLIQEDSTQFLLTPLSSLTWKYQGGSYPWPNSQTSVSINGKQHEDKNPILHCGRKQVGRTPYQLLLSNIQTKKLLFPATQTSSINITCQFPSKLELNLENGQIFQEIYLTPNVEVKGRIWPVDNQGNPYYNSSNIVYKYSALNGKIRGSDTTFLYKPDGNYDEIGIYTDRLKDQTSFERVALNFKISVIQPIKIQHLLAESTQDQLTPDFRKVVKIITLFTPKKPYLLNLTYDNSFLQLRCNESVSCIKLPSAVQVNLNSLGRGFVSIKDRRAYGSTEWIFEFQVVQADEIKVQGSPTSVPEGQNFNVTIFNLFKGTKISPLLYEDNHLHLVLPKHLKVITQYGNRFLVNAGKTGIYDIHGQLDYPRTVISRTPFQLAVYERIEPDFSGFTYAKTEGKAMISGETNVIIGCQRLLSIKGGPKLLKVTPIPDSSLVVTAISSRTFSLVGKRQGSFKLIFSISHNTQEIAQMSVIVIVSNIQSVELISINQPIIGAQFRILPRFKIGQKAVQGCICDFDYRWSAQKGRVRLGSSASMGFLVAGGINATAITVGQETITLKISNKADNKIISSITKNLLVKRSISLQLHTVIGGALQTSETIRIAPSTSYEFSDILKLDVQGPSLKKNSSNSLTAVSTGLSIVKLFSQGSHTEVIMVESTPIKGIFIQNDGVAIVEPNSTRKIPIYLIDNHGRLFVTPLQGLQISVESSSPHILKVSLTADQNYIEIEGLSFGSCTLTVATRNVYDAISVSVGSQLFPSSDARVLRNGKVYYRIQGETKAAWTSSNPKVVSINEKTGLALAHQIGKVKISNGDLGGWLEVVMPAHIEQHSFSVVHKGVYEIIYKVYIEGKSKLEELPSFSERSGIDNSFYPYCLTDSRKWFNIRSQIREYQGKEVLVCIATAILPFDSTDFPSILTITVHDSSEALLARFNYPSRSGFYFDESKSTIVLTPLKPRQTLKIQTDEEVNVTADDDRKSLWVSSSFSKSDRLQTVIIDMTGESCEQVWELQLSTSNQKETITIFFSKTETAENRDLSFFSFSFDWPEYLIMLMALVFGTLCVIQYLSQEKYKNS